MLLKLKFCTKFPDELKDVECQQKYFPLEFRYSDYIHQGTNIRDMRARQVTMGIRLDVLDLDKPAHLKFRQLVGDRYNKDTDVFIVVSDRCPSRKQNREYSEYLLTVLYYESNKTEPCEPIKEDSPVKEERRSLTNSLNENDTILRAANN
uniref:Ribosomal protein S24/S35 mitochondrial conserved domain-containing protein n=1 Tax=Meloidogyne incognita TaxID=6306 RepID=A0A914MAM5_MELIC